MGKYQISVILPVYNVSPYIDEAFSSLLRQTIGFESLQVIFVDDCSTDNSGAKIDQYAAEHENVLAIHMEKNSGGPGMPRNVALSHAEAPYIMFLDPDDTYVPEACKFLLEKIKASDAEIVDGDYSAVDEDGQAIYARWPDAKELGETQFILPGDLAAAVRYRGSFWSKIYRTEFLRRNQILFPEDIIGEDLVFYCRCLSCARKIEFYPISTYIYRVRSKKAPSLTYTFSLDYFIKVAECYRQCRDIFENVCGTPSAFTTLCYWVVEDYTLKMIDSMLSVQELMPVLKEWQWLFLLMGGEKHVSLFSALISPWIQEGDFHAAANILEGLRPIRKYNLELETGKQWISQKLDREEKELAELHTWASQLVRAKQYLERQTEGKDIRIAELEKWTAELQSGKNYLEQQIVARDTRIGELSSWVARLQDGKSYLEGQIPQKDTRIRELEGWTAKLEEARDYLSEQIEQKDSRISELEAWTIQLEGTRDYLSEQIEQKDSRILELEAWNAQLEGGKAYLESQLDKESELRQKLQQEKSALSQEVSKLNFKLNLLLSDSKVQKIIQKKHYEV